MSLVEEGILNKFNFNVVEKLRISFRKFYSFKSKARPLIHCIGALLGKFNSHLSTISEQTENILNNIWGKIENIMELQRMIQTTKYSNQCGKTDKNNKKLISHCNDLSLWLVTKLETDFWLQSVLCAKNLQFWSWSPFFATVWYSVLSTFWKFSVSAVSNLKLWCPALWHLFETGKEFQIQEDGKIEKL